MDDVVCSEHDPSISNLIDTMPKRTSTSKLFRLLTTIVAIFKSLLCCILLNPLLCIQAIACDLHRLLYKYCCCSCLSRQTISRAATQEPLTNNNDSMTTRRENGSASLYNLQGDWIVHERQSLQLCAVHTINNLLQLAHDDRDLPWRCARVIGKKRVFQKSNNNNDNNNHILSTSVSAFQWYQLPSPATQVELDNIACDLMQAEQALLDDYPYRFWVWSWFSSRFCKSLTNNHRTLYYGNYSFETLELALQHRQVSLEWFHIPTDTNDLLNVPAGVVVGFIINHVMNNESDFQDSNNPSASLKRKHSLPRSLLRRTCCDDPGRHWYAITRVRRQGDDAGNFMMMINNSKNSSKDSSSSNNTSIPLDEHVNLEAPEDDLWKILDSDSAGDAAILTTDEIREYLYQVSNQDATIFRATLILP